ncbi:hypothetical protein H0A66_07360 [Alcaligenaceae bacterium]|nr:hypothetical protein [Alcaligenaceae bacterium]
MAVEDFAVKYPKIQADVVSADHQNKTDVGLAIARPTASFPKMDKIFSATQ